MKLGGLVLEAQDIEVLSRDWLHEYFLTRDVTQNEVCLVKARPALPRGLPNVTANFQFIQPEICD